MMFRHRTLVILVVLVALLFGMSVLYAKEQKMGARARSNYRGARVDLQRGDNAIALDKFLKVLEDEPDHVLSLKNIADLYFLRSEDEPPEEEKATLLIARRYYMMTLETIAGISDWRSYDDFETIKEDAENKLESIFARIFTTGREMYDEQNYDGAEQIYQELAAIYADRYQPLQMLAAIAKQRGDNDKAIEYQQMILSLDPDNTRILYNLAEDFEKEEDWDNAMHYYSLFVEKEPENADGYIALADISEKKEDLQSAIGYYEQVLIFEPDNAAVAEKAADIAQKMGDTEKEIALLKIWVASEGSEENLMWICGRLSRNQKWDDLLEYSRKWYDQNNESEEAVQFIIYAARQLNDNATVKEFEEILKGMN